MQLGPAWDNGELREEIGAYPVQMCGNVAIGVQCSLLAAQLDDLAGEADGAVGEGLEVGGVDAGGGEWFGHVGFGVWFLFVVWRVIGVLTGRVNEVVGGIWWGAVW